MTAFDTIPAQIFKAYDIRGRFASQLTPELMYLIGQALGTQALQAGETSFIVGRDGRLSSPVLSQGFMQGLAATGCDVVDIGVVPTPVLYFAAKTSGYSSSGAMITGSHNPPDENGLKMVVNNQALSGQAVQAIYHQIKASDFLQGQGHIRQQDFLASYLERILSTVQVQEPLKVVLDCGNGAACVAAPKLFRQLGCEVIELYCDLDGHFPNHSPDPSQPENLTALIDKVLQEQADIGLIFDGDADRLGVVSNQGEIIWADRQMILFAREVLQVHPKATIIFDVKCSAHLASAILQLGGQPIMWKTGHSFIKAKMQEIGAKLAGEMSGHIFFNDRWFGFDDGLYAGARLLEILSKNKADITKVFTELPNSISTPELRIPMPDDAKFAFMQRLEQTTAFGDAQVHTIDGLRVECAEGWGLIRPSNTSAYLIARFEAESSEAILRIQARFAQAIREIDPSLVLPF